MAVTETRRILPRVKSRLARGIMAFAALLVVVVAAGSAYNYVAHGYYVSRAIPPGRFYSVHGRAMYLYCTGTGSPTVVLEGGLGDTWIAWQQVQPTLSSVTRVCSYDRAGLGFSQPQAGSRDAIHVVEQLHVLLGAAGISGPLLLVGQSAGGLYVREFATRYPRDVVGLVLVDGTPPASFARIAGAQETPFEKEQRHRKAWLKAFEDTIGLSRLLGKCSPVPRSGLAAYRAYLLAQACRPAYDVSWLGEFDDFETSAREVAGTTFGALPFLIISQDPDRPKAGWSHGEVAANPIWAAMQEESKSLSTHSRRIVARNSGHRVQNDRPDIVISAIAELVSELRNPTRDSKSVGMTMPE